MFSGHPASAFPNEWVIGPVIVHRDSTLIAQSNSRVLLREIAKHPEFEDQWETHDFSHWAVGWVTHFSFKAFEDGGLKPTAIYVWLRDWFAKLADYPIADDDDHSAMSDDATYENVKIAVSLYRDPDDRGIDFEHDKIYAWLREHKERSLDDNDDMGGYPDDKAIAEAIEAIYGPAKEEGDSDDSSE